MSLSWTDSCRIVPAKDQEVALQLPRCQFLHHDCVLGHVARLRMRARLGSRSSPRLHFNSTLVQPWEGTCRIWPFGHEAPLRLFMIRRFVSAIRRPTAVESGLFADRSILRSSEIVKGPYNCNTIVPSTLICLCPAHKLGPKTL